MQHQPAAAAALKRPVPPTMRTPPPLAVPASSSPGKLWAWLARGLKEIIVPELRKQRGITLPLAVMNLSWFAKTAVTTIFLGRFGELQLAGGTLGYTFTTVTGFAVLNGLCGAMEPICGQAFGARNYRLLHKTLLMATAMLLAAAAPISIIWLKVDKILISVGQKADISHVAKVYVKYLLPHLAVTSLLCPLKSYLSAQGVTVPLLFSTVIAMALHVPINIWLSRVWGLQGVATAVWVTDLSIVIMLAAYVVAAERRSVRVSPVEGGGWLELQSMGDWLRLLRLSWPCCLFTCLEWWCYEILVLLTGRLPDSRRMVAVLGVVLNFDFLLYAVMLSLGTCTSTRVSNELGAGASSAARRAAYVSLGLGLVAGLLGAAATAGAGGLWGSLFSREAGTVDEVRKTMLFMALVEVMNFPLTVCGGIVRGTARPWLGMYSNLGGFYLVALPLGSALAFGARLGLAGLLLGFLAGAATSTAMLLVMFSRIDWAEETRKAHALVGVADSGRDQEDLGQAGATEEMKV